MGLGDELMALGEAWAYYSCTGQNVSIIDKNGKHRMHPLWRGHAWLQPDGYKILNGSGCRPYIDYERSTADRWAFQEYKASHAVLPWCKPRLNNFVIIEPNLKGNAPVNKQWGKWQAMVDAAPFVRWAQFDTGPILHGVEVIPSDTFETAINWLAGAEAAVLPEGGLHHAAEAVGLPAAVIFGAFTRPDITGYDNHINIAVDDPDGLGWRIPNETCRAAMDSISVKQVLNSLEEILDGQIARGCVASK